MEENKIVREYLRVEKPHNQDVIIVFKIRYTEWIGEDGNTVTLQEYGGFPNWKQYKGHEIFDVSKDGGFALQLDGLEWEQVKYGVEKLDEENRDRLHRLYVDLKGIFNE